MKENELLADLRAVSPDDHYIDWSTWKRIVDWFRAQGLDEDIPIDMFDVDNDIVDQTFAQIISRVRTENAAGDIPDDTSTFMYEAVEVAWDSSTLTWETIDGGFEWNGAAAGSSFDQNYLRLAGQPGFGDQVYNYGPLLTDAVVPVFRVNEGAFYTAASENGAEITLDDFSWYFTYMGEDPIVHPFKATLGDNKKKVVVGYMRDFIVNAGDGTDIPNSSHTGADLITIMGGVTPTVITLDSADELEVAGLRGTDSIIYYEIDLSSGAPAATLMESENKEWPPAAPSDQSNILLIPVCYVRITGPELPTPADPAISTIGQLLFEHVTFASSASTAPVIGATRSNQIINKLVQFINDVNFDPTSPAPTVVPARVGSVSESNRGYGGQEEGSRAVGRHYKWMANIANVIDSFFMPGTNAFKQATGNALGLGFLNKMWIHIDPRFDGQTEEIHHMLCDTDFFETADGPFSVTPAGGVKGIVWGSATENGDTDIPMAFDRTGHLRKLDDVYGDEDDYPKDIFVVLTGDSYPSSGTLYNVQLTQTANLIDLAGADTDAFNGPIGTLAYTALTAAGDPLSIGFTSSIGNSLAAAAANIPFAVPVGGTGGNDDDIFWDLSKHLDGTDVVLKVFLIAENRSAFAEMTDIESVQLVTTIQTTPVPDNVSFDVKVELEDGIGGQAAQGTQFTRFDGDDEYRVVVYLFLEANKAAFDPDDAATYIQKQTATVDDQTTYSGATVSFTEDFEDSETGTTVCARAYLEFFQANVPPQPLPNQIGRCNISNAGDFAEDCQLIAGTTPTATLAFSAETYNPASLGNVTVEFVPYQQVTPIEVVYQLQKGGDTTDFTGDNSSFILTTPSGTEIKILDVNQNAINTIVLTNPSDGNATDGFVVTIHYIEAAFVSDGDQYLGKVISPVAATDDFTFNTASAFPATDYWGSRATDLPFPWPDFGGETTEQSANTSGAPYTTRFNEVQSIGSNALTSTIVSGDLKLAMAGGSLTLWELKSKNDSIYGAFEITCDIDSIDVSLLVTVADSMNAGIQVDIGGSSVFVAIDYENGGSPELNIIADITGTFTKTTSAGASSGTLKIQRDSSDVVSVYFNDVQFGANKVVTGAVNVWGPRLALVSGSSRNTNAVFNNFVPKAEAVDGSLVNYFTPNSDRWAMSLSGTGYQIVNPTTDKLEQIIPAAGLSTVSLLSKFSDDIDILNSLGSFLFTMPLSEMAFDTNKEQVYLRVTNSNSDVWQIGFQYDASATQEFFVNIGAGDLGVTALTTAAATIAIDYDGTDVTFLLDAVVKHTISSWAGYDITDIDIITVTNAASALSDAVDSIDVQAPTGTQFTFDPT